MSKIPLWTKIWVTTLIVLLYFIENLIDFTEEIKAIVYDYIYKGKW